MRVQPNTTRRSRHQRCGPWLLLVLVAAIPTRAQAGELFGEVGVASTSEPDGSAAAMHLGGAASGSPDGGIYELATGGDLAVGVGVLGLVRGNHWLSIRYDASKAQAAAKARREATTTRPTTTKPTAAKPLDAWVTFRHRLEFETRAALGRRRDLVRSRYTSEQLGMEAVLLGDGDPLSGGALMPFTYDVDLVRGEAAVRHTFRGTVARWWSRAAADQPEHAREVLTIISQVHDLDFDATADTLIAWAETGRPLSGDLYLDYRTGFATNTGETSIDNQMFVNERHPNVTAGVLDGGLRLVRGAAAGGLRYDRSLYLTFDSMLALEDRATASATLTHGPTSLGAEGFAARTLLFSERGVDAERAVTGGGAAHWSTSLRGFGVSGSVEVARSFYAHLDNAVGEPAWGWRAQLQLSRGFGTRAR